MKRERFQIADPPPFVFSQNKKHQTPSIDLSSKLCNSTLTFSNSEPVKHLKGGLAFRLYEFINKVNQQESLYKILNQTTEINVTNVESCDELHLIKSEMDGINQNPIQIQNSKTLVVCSSNPVPKIIHTTNIVNQTRLSFITDYK